MRVFESTPGRVVLVLAATVGIIGGACVLVWLIAAAFLIFPAAINASEMFMIAPPLMIGAVVLLAIFFGRRRARRGAATDDSSGVEVEPGGDITSNS